MLYEGYKAFKEKKPLQEEDIRQIRDQLAEAVSDLIECGCYAIRPSEQEDYLKAAVYGKVFLNNTQIDPYILHDAAKYLKIKHNMMEDLGRAITYDQMVLLGDNELIELLLNSKAHFLALKACQLLKLPAETFSRIYIDWAITAIDRDKNNDEVKLAERIYSKFAELQNTQGINIDEIALTEIAHEAAKNEKKELAKKLLEHESSITRKIPVLVWMREYEKSLEEAFKGKDTNLIHLVLLKFFDIAEKEARIRMYDKIKSLGSALETQFINFMKMTNKGQFLEEYLDFIGPCQTRANETLFEASRPIKVEQFKVSKITKIFKNSTI